MDIDMRACSAEEDLFSPKGVEAQVVALAAVRGSAWWRLPARARLVLEVADYLGLEQACGLQVRRVEALFGVLPEPLRQRCLALAACGTVGSAVFSGPAGGTIERGDVVAWIADAFASGGSS
jgi:hypothetical protein